MLRSHMHSRHLRVEIYEAFYSVAKDNISIVYLTPKKINWTCKAEDVSLHSQKPSFIQSAFRNRLMMAAEKLKQNVKGIPHKHPHPHNLFLGSHGITHTWKLSWDLFVAKNNLASFKKAITSFAVTVLK